MIDIKNKKNLKGAEKYGDCNSCGKRSSETELYQISFCYENSTKNHIVNLCRDCVIKLKDMIDVEI